MHLFKLVLVNIIILSFFVAGCSDESNPVTDIPEPNIEGNTYYNPELNFQISAPDGWSLTKDTDAAGYHLMLLGVYTKNKSSQTTFNIISEHTGSNDGIEEYMQAAKENINNMFTGVEFYSERTVAAGGLECGEVVCQFNRDGAIYILKQLYFCSNNSIVIITFNCLSSFYLQVSNDFDSIQKSLKAIR